MDLFRAHVNYIHEILKVVVVCEHKYFMLAAFGVMLPSLECFNNGQ